MLTHLFIFFVCGFIAAYVTNVLLLNFSQSLGIRNKNDVIVRWSNQSKPSLGGISFFVVFIFASLFYSFFPQNEYIFHELKYIGLFIAGCLAFIMGLADDAYNTKPMLKFGAQLICGMILTWTGTIINVTPIPILNYALTIFWVVLLMNSLNMLDNMDGITGTVVLFIIATCIASKWIITGVDASFWSLLNIAMIGGLLGFLKHNIHPSKIFMGDAGSQFIGLYVAFITVDQLWLVGSTSYSFNFIGFCLITVCFAAPFADTLTVVINRLKRGQSPMVGGKDHTTHHLVYAGYSDKSVWKIFMLIAAVAMLLTIGMIYLYQTGNDTLVIPFLIFPLCIFIILYRNTLKFPEKKTK